MGFASQTLLYANLCSLIIVIVFDVRKGIIASILFFIIISIAAFMFWSGKLVVPVDLNHYSTSLSAWATIMLSGLIANGLILISLGNIQKQLNSTVEELEIEKQLVEKLANYDSLTGLPISRFAIARGNNAIDLAKRNGSKVAVMFLDLDKFKFINDEYGHEAGDQVLISVGKRLQTIFRESDNVSRIGGDEFLIIIPDVREIRDVKKITERLLNSMAEPIEYNGFKLKVRISIGVAFFPDDGSDIETLKRVADTNMYGAKRSGGNNWQFTQNNFE